MTFAVPVKKIFALHAYHILAYEINEYVGEEGTA